MSVRAIWASRARISELATSRVVRAHCVLSWMQEAAALASAEAGYPIERYSAMNAGWLIRGVRIAFDRLIPLGSTVEVETWVSRIHRFRSQREYRVRSDEVVVARASAEWLFLERSAPGLRPQPRHPDSAMLAAFPVLAEQVFEGTRADWRGLSDTPAEACNASEVRVARSTEIDLYGHVNHAVYLAWIEDHLADLWGRRSLREARISYLADVKERDEVRIRSWDAGGAFEVVVDRAGEPVLRARVD